MSHEHYFKDVTHLKTIDVYRVLDLFDVSNPCVQHAIKKWGVKRLQSIWAYLFRALNVVTTM